MPAVLNFRRGTVEEITDRLKHVVEIENKDRRKNDKIELDSDALDIIARSANGSFRDSLSLLEQVMAYTEESITAKDVYTVLGMVDEEALLEIGEVLASGDAASAFALRTSLCERVGTSGNCSSPPRTIFVTYWSSRSARTTGTPPILDGATRRTRSRSLASSRS